MFSTSIVSTSIFSSQIAIYKNIIPLISTNNEPIKEAIIEEKPEVPKKEENKVSDDAFFDDFFSDD